MTEKVWFRSIIQALISGAAGGVLTGLAAMGIEPNHFNLVAPAALLKMTAAAACVNALIGVAQFLQKSPLPED